MGRILKNRKFQITAAVVLLLVLVLFSADRFSNVNIVRNIVTIPVTFVQKGVKAVGGWFDGKISGLQDYADLVEENARLKDENLRLREDVADMADLSDENERLREALKLKDMFSGYEVIGANIIGSEPGNFYYNFRIDAGSLDGISIDDPVVAADNVLVGRVYSVNLTSAVIVPFIDERSGISAWTSKEEGGHGVVKGDIEYKAKGLCIMDTISEDVVLREKDVVETSGMGGIYPRGILIGTVEEIFKSDSLIERYALVRPLVDLNSIREVFILKEKGSVD